MFRLFVLFLLLLTMAVVALVQFAEPLITIVAERQLKAADMHLTQFKLGKLSPSLLTIDAVSVESDGLEVSATGVTLVLLQNAESFVAVESLSVALVENREQSTGMPAAPSTAAPSTLGQSFDTLNESLPLLPKQGYVKQIEYCQPGICINANARWRRWEDKLAAQIMFPVQNLWVSIEHDQRWELELLIDNPLVVGQGAVQVDATSTDLVMNHELAFAPKETVALEPLSTVFERIELQGNIRLPKLSELDQLVSDAQSDNLIRMAATSEAILPQGNLKMIGEHSATLAYRDQDLFFSMTELPAITFDLVDVGAGAAALDEALDCEISLGLGAASCEVGSVTVSIEASVEEQLFAADLKLLKTRMIYSVGEVEADGVMGLDVFDLNNGTQVLGGEIDFTLTPDVIKMKTVDMLILGSRFQIDVQTDALIEAGLAKIESQGQDQVKALLKYAANLLDDDTLTSTAKSLSAHHKINSSIEWSNSGAVIQQETHLTFDDVAVTYDGYEVSGGAVESHLLGWPVMSGSVQVRANSIEVGVPLQQFNTLFDVRFDVDASNAVVYGAELGFNVLGGAVSSQQFEYETSSAMGNAIVGVDNLQLGALLALQEQDIQASGLLSGSVPVQISDGKLHFSNAKIDAVAPGGYLKYRAEDSVRLLAKDNAGLSVVLDAMENFQYHTLGADVDFGLDGQMIARTSLKGANPNYQGGREVHLNLTLEENILTLLKSLRLGSDLATKIGQDRF